MRNALYAILMMLSAANPAAADPVRLTDSGICHCPGGKYYDDIKRSREFGDLASCLATGAREPRSGQGDCASTALGDTSGTVTQRGPLDRHLTTPYERSLYGKGWADDNSDCRNTRAEVLIAQSVAPVRMRRSGCSVDAGRWNDPYTGKVFTRASELDIDHLVPLAWAHAHGGHSWSPEKRLAFANWAPNLFPVEASANRQKGADGPLRWLPPRTEYRCEYIVRFERVVLTWGLSFTPDERAGMDEIKAHWCPSR